jgi:hypothetical protein
MNTEPGIRNAAKDKKFVEVMNKPQAVSLLKTLFAFRRNRCLDPIFEVSGKCYICGEDAEFRYKKIVGASLYNTDLLLDDKSELYKSIHNTRFCKYCCQLAHDYFV